jgi:hypothetical protein
MLIGKRLALARSESPNQERSSWVEAFMAVTVSARPVGKTNQDDDDVASRQLMAVTSSYGKEHEFHLCTEA